MAGCTDYCGCGDDGGDWGEVDDDSGATYPRCGPYCGLQAVRPGKVQCDCDSDETYDAFDPANAVEDQRFSWDQWRDLGYITDEGVWTDGQPRA